MNENKNDVIELLNKLVESIAKIICKTPITQKEFINHLRYKIAHVSRELNPTAPISKLSQITGLPRATIDDFLNQRQPQKTKVKLSDLLNELWNEKDKNNCIVLKGEKSFYSLAKKILTSSYSPEIALNTLIKLDAISFKKDGLLQIHSVALNVTKDDTEYYTVVANSVDRLIETLLYNKESKIKRYQNSRFSDQIPPIKFKDLHDEMFDYFKQKVFVDIKGIFEKYKENVPHGTYPKIGYSIYEFLEDQK